jgi:hypothetical protein
MSCCACGSPRVQHVQPAIDGADERPLVRLPMDCKGSIADDCERQRSANSRHSAFRSKGAISLGSSCSPFPAAKCMLPNKWLQRIGRMRVSRASWSLPAWVGC